jgi:hypothetical protein
MQKEIKLSTFKKDRPGFPQSSTLSLLSDEDGDSNEDQEEFSKLDRLSAMADNLGDEWFHNVMSHCEEE